MTVWSLSIHHTICLLFMYTITYLDYDSSYLIHECFPPPLSEPPPPSPLCIDSLIHPPDWFIALNPLLFYWVRKHALWPCTCHSRPACQATGSWPSWRRPIQLLGYFWYWDGVELSPFAKSWFPHWAVMPPPVTHRAQWNHLTRWTHWYPD